MASLIIKSPGKSGCYTSKWRICYTDSKGEIHQIGESFSLEFVILDKQIVNQDKPVLVVKQPEIKEEMKQKVYPSEVTEKAKKILDFLPQYSLEFLQETIQTSPKLTIEELLENLLS